VNSRHPSTGNALRYEDFRREYLAGGLSREDLDPDPVRQFERWLAQATEGGLKDPTGMVLATVDADGYPWQRIVLLKNLSPRGFVFFTNYGSAKARAMAADARVSLHFPWNELDRQVVVGGLAERLSASASARYFLSRPRESQLAAWASRQSRPVSARALLEQQFNRMKEKFAHGEIPVPDFWGGYCVVPQKIEFWQGGAHRLHDRFLYTRRAEGGWEIEQLQP